MAASKPKYDENGYNSSGRRQIVGVKTKPNESQEAARKLEDSGFKVKDGQLTPTQDYGEMVALASEQRNSLSRDSKPGSVSTLGNPMNSMYAANPGFFNRGGRGGAVVSPEAARAQNIAKAKEAGTFDSIRDQYNAKGGAQMNEFGTIGAAAPAAVAAAPAAPATAESVAAQRASIQGAAAPAATAGISMTDQLINGASQKPIKSPMRPLETAPAPAPAPAPVAPAPAAPAPVAPAPAAPSQMDLNRQALEQGAAGIRLQREAMGQMPQSITSDRGYKVVTDAKGNIVGTNAPAAAVGDANQRAAINRGEGTMAEKSDLGLNIRKTALAELSRPAPKPMTTAPAAPAAPAASTLAAAPILNRGNPIPLANPTPLDAGGNLAPPKNIFSPPNIPTQTAASPTAATPRIAPDFRALKELDSSSSAPAAAPPPASTPSPVSGMTINNPTSLKSGTPTPLAPPTSLNSSNKMVPTKDDITKQRASLASTKR